MDRQTFLPDDLRADAARNRARVLAVAREQVAEGDVTLQMNTIARLAGVGVGTVYRHFPTQRALLESLAMDSFEELVDEARSAADEEDPGTGLERLLRFTLRRQLEDAGLAEVLRSSESAYVKTSQLRVDLFETASQLLGRTRDAGALRPEIGADDLRRLLCGIEHAVRMGDGGQDEIDRYMDVLLGGIRPRR